VARVGLLQLEQLLFDQRVDLLLGAEQLAQLGDALLDVAVLVLDSLALERGQRAQAQLEDRNGLDLREVERLHQPVLRGVGVGGLADECDHGV
jgi:hypothetical protein